MMENPVGPVTRSSSIPTDDPLEALRFCRALAQVMSPAHGPLLEPMRPVLSVVVPVYDEADNLAVLHRRLTTVLSEIEPQYEIVFVDDGSRERSVRDSGGTLAQLRASSRH